MRHLIIDNIRKIICCISALETVLAVWMIGAILQTGDRVLIGVLLLDIGLIIDAVLMAANSNERLSRLRFIAHGVLTPLLFPLSSAFAGASGIVQTIVWVITAVLMVIGFWMGIDLNLAPVTIGRLQRFTQAKENRKIFQIMSFILTAGLLLPLIVSGIFVLVAQGSPLILLAAVFMFAFTAIAPATKNFDLLFVTSMAGELIMTACMVLFRLI